MLKETYLANLRNLPPGALTVRVARPSRLAPSLDLLRDWKAGTLTWAEYESRFKAEIMGRPDAVEKMKEIRDFCARRCLPILL
ncbi:unnamed protein product [marine sediment metagenome]|uniref:Uncharacterized protein n=1 Tax=marine sediment metagenome TaxID=412755 RepID=X1VNZ2_9ZZZZ